LEWNEKLNGCDRDRTDDLYRVKVALIPTELRTPRIQKLYGPVENVVNALTFQGGDLFGDQVQAAQNFLKLNLFLRGLFRDESQGAAGLEDRAIDIVQR
jgi:hypothetical protein